MPTETRNRIIQVDYGVFYVESSDGTQVHRVILNGQTCCTCEDFRNNSTGKPGYQCRHILAVLHAQPDNVYRIEPNTVKKLKLDERFITTINGREFALYAGLLDLGHQKGVRSIAVEVVQLPNEQNDHTAVCKCTLESSAGETYVEWGDANPGNVNRKIARHIIRMAATRAKARALRDFTNVGMTALEELGDFEEAAHEEYPQRQRQAPPETRKQEPATESASLSTISDAQMRALSNLARRQGISEEELDTMSQDMFGSRLRSLSASDAGSFIRNLQSA